MGGIRPNMCRQKIPKIEIHKDNQATNTVGLHYHLSKWSDGARVNKGLANLICRGIIMAPSLP